MVSFRSDSVQGPQASCDLVEFNSSTYQPQRQLNRRNDSPRESPESHYYHNDQQRTTQNP
jgi:hypothetical protein